MTIERLADTVKLTLDRLPARAADCYKHGNCLLHSTLDGDKALINSWHSAVLNKLLHQPRRATMTSMKTTVPEQTRDYHFWYNNFIPRNLGNTPGRLKRVAPTRTRWVVIYNQVQLTWLSPSRLPRLWVTVSLVLLPPRSRCRRSLPDDVLLDGNDSDDRDDELMTNGSTDGLLVLTMFDSFDDLPPRDFV